MTNPTAHGALTSVNGMTYNEGDLLHTSYRAICNNGSYIFDSCAFYYQPATPPDELG